MSETDLGGVNDLKPETSTAEGGFLHIEETSDAPPADEARSTPFKDVQPAIPLSPQAIERSGSVEHLAARRPVSKIDEESPEIKERLNLLRPEITRLLTGLRWNGRSADEVAEELIPLLNIGSVQQWQEILIPYLFEIDRAGNLLPVWYKIIDQGDPQDLPPSANPAETMQGRARRYSILMLGNYKSGIAGEEEKALGFFRGMSSKSSKDSKVENVKKLGQLASDPNSSLYAAAALVKQGTAEAVQELISALKTAQGWAKVDVIENCLVLKQTYFHDILLASGLDNLSGLESYVAIPLYRELPLEDYLSGSKQGNTRLKQQAALIVSQVLQDSMTPPGALAEKLPPIFERPLPPLAQALFAGARSTPHWSNVLAIHRLGLLLGRYWSEISRGTLQDPKIIEPVYGCLPMMNDVERWMAGPGRDVLLKTLNDSEEEAQVPVVKTLGELREPRAIAPLLEYIEQVKSPENREQAQRLAVYNDTLGQMGDQRASGPLRRMLERTVERSRRSTLPRRTENLPIGDKDIPGSIVYGSGVRALGRLGDRTTRAVVQQACEDFDPFVRTQALEALKQLDPTGEDAKSREIARASLHDGRENIVRIACQLIIQYKEYDAIPTLREIIQERPTLAATAYDTLRQLGQ